MFKTFLALLAAACLLSALAAAVGYLPFIPPLALLAAACAVLLLLALIAGVRWLAVAACAVLAGVSLSACGSLGGGAGGQGFADIVKSIATDSRCGHEDSIQFVAGVLSGSASRHCPVPGQVAPPLQVGAVAAPTPTSATPPTP